MANLRSARRPASYGTARRDSLKTNEEQFSNTPYREFLLTPQNEGKTAVLRRVKQPIEAAVNCAAGKAISV
jgi:hypothetical protein